MSNFVLDASAILAVLHREPGGEVVVPLASGALVSAVNVAEAGARLADWDMRDGEARRAILELGIVVVPFDAELAFDSSALRTPTRRWGLSLGDRACLALAKREGLPALTADHAWLDLDIGVEVRLIRGVEQDARE